MGELALSDKEPTQAMIIASLADIQGASRNSRDNSQWRRSHRFCAVVSPDQWIDAPTFHPRRMMPSDRPRCITDPNRCTLPGKLSPTDLPLIVSAFPAFKPTALEQL